MKLLTSPLPRILCAFAVATAVSVAVAYADVTPAGPEIMVDTGTQADTVTVGERFDVMIRAVHPDSLRPVTPAGFPAGTCRLLAASWEDIPHADRHEWTGRVTCIAVSIDSVVVPALPLDFVAPDGDTLRAWTEPLHLALRYLSAGSKDLRPLKEQWTLPPNYAQWILIALAGLALIAAAIWWFRRRRARRTLDDRPVVVVPPDIVALTEFERIEAMGLVTRGEYKMFYTLVVDALRRYVAARFGVEALDRTTAEIMDDLVRAGRTVDGLEALLTEADLVKFAKFRPQADAANAAIASARDIVVATTPRPVAAPAAEGTAA